MNQAAGTRETLAALAPLFEYPGGGFDETLEAAACAAVRPAGAARALARFRGEAETCGIEALQDRYTRTFDLGPTCAPYLGVHLFGPESAKRGRLMAELAVIFHRGGLERRGELPDHVALVLRFAPRFDEREWDELVEFCLAPALARMERDCERGGDPYRHVLRAVRVVLDGGEPAERCHD